MRCDLRTGADPPDSVLLSWRATVLGDPALPPEELSRRIQARAFRAPRVDGGYPLSLPPQADVLLVLDETGLQEGRVADAIALAWDEQGGRCLVATDLRHVPVQGCVDGLAEGDRVEVFVCGQWWPVDSRGCFQAHAPASSTCLAYATRQDGMLGAVGGIVELDLSAGGHLPDLRLDLPEQPIAGIGAALTPVQGGVEVLEFVPGGTAEAAGLESGDLVVAVDGEAVDGWDLADVVQAITGPAGTRVTLQVVHADDEEERLVIERRPVRVPDEAEAAP